MVHKMAIKGHYGERGVRLLSPLCCLQMISYFVGWLGGGGRESLFGSSIFSGLLWSNS